MSRQHGASVVTNGLVMYYDMNNTQKSWKGAPTTNLFASNLVATNSTKTLSLSEFASSYIGWEATGVSSDNPRVSLFNGSVTIAASTFYTLSCIYWSSNNIVGDLYLRFTDTGWVESNNYIQPFTGQSTTRNGSFSITDLGNNWKRCIGTFQTLSTTTTLSQLFFDADIANVQVFIANIQLEQLSFASPLVTTSGTTATRSNTQAIVDLTGNTTLTANSLTYASDGTFSFNGTSDYITAPSTALAVTSWTQPWTLGVWMYVPASATWSDGTNQSHFVSKGNTVGSWGLIRGANNNSIHAAIRTDAGVYQTGGSITRDAWYNVVGTWDGISTVNTYINGALVDFATATTLSGVPDTQDLTIGRAANTFAGSPGTYYTGKLPSVVGYNRALSATEVQQNFNATRARYGL